MSSLPLVFRQKSVEMVMECCYSCGVLFAFPADMKLVLLDTHHTFYCPNGHQQQYLAKSEAETLREALERQKGMTQIELAMRLESEKEQAKLRKRIGNGVCPCCSRSFQNLRSHMRTKHPNQKQLSA